MKDFSPKSQDAVALQQIKERGALPMIESVYVFAIMMVAYYAGQLVMNTFGISIPGLRIAGGLIVAFIGF
ncbi:hypothetical protein MJN47_28875, partial [Salmonella enterica subsp. enterica serovar Lubbock]|nr:hypothetical protein [Salmonella enterica subsp. enterica serovar Lubbock]